MEADSRLLPPVSQAKQFARAGIRSLDEGLYAAAVLSLENALGMAKEALWVSAEILKEKRRAATTARKD